MKYTIYAEDAEGVFYVRSAETALLAVAYANRVFADYGSVFRVFAVRDADGSEIYHREVE